jgi:hypothetical protein
MLPGDQTDVRPRAEIALYGYHRNSVTSAWGGALAGRDFVSLPDLLRTPLTVEDRLKKVPDGTGNFIEMQVPFPIWVKAHTDGGTPMLQALRKARDIARDWAASHQSSYPPVIVNITDGMASDSTQEGDLEAVAQEITDISTEDGHALLFTIHVTELKAYPVEYPASEDELPRDRFARRLFALSSVIPDTALAALNSLLGRTVPPGAKGFVFNGDAEAVLLMFRFASAPAIQVVDPNR